MMQTVLFQSNFQSKQKNCTNIFEAFNKNVRNEVFLGMDGSQKHRNCFTL